MKSRSARTGRRRHMQIRFRPSRKYRRTVAVIIRRCERGLWFGDSAAVDPELRGFNEILAKEGFGVCE